MMSQGGKQKTIVRILPNISRRKPSNEIWSVNRI